MEGRAIELFIKRPFFGWGPGTYAFVYAPFQKSKDLTIIALILEMVEMHIVNI